LSDGLSAERLAELERIWELDPSSRAFVQLAEEYRRLGDLSRAAQVLQKGLESHPHYLSALVALGRCKLDLGAARDAIEILQRALAQDPSQLVANKLLVEAHLAVGEPDQAKERLDFYRLFNDRDEEIEGLESKIAAAAERRPGPPTVPGKPRSENVFDLAPRAELPPLELGGAARSARPGPAREAEPFGSLYDSASASRQITAALASGGVFAVAAAVEEAPPAPLPPPLSPIAQSKRSAVVELEESTEPSADAPPAPPWGAATSTADLEQEVVEEVIAEPFRPRTIGEEVERETIEEPFDEVLQAPSVSPRTVETPPPPFSEQEEEIAIEQEPEEAPAADEADAYELDLTEPEPQPGIETEPPPEAPSSTLGELYLSQGHLDDAESEFRRVLAARPDDAVANAGLEEIERRRRPLDDTSAGWTEEEAESTPEPVVSTPIGGGLTRRKVQTLRSYLDRIRRGRSSADVS